MISLGKVSKFEREQGLMKLDRDRLSPTSFTRLNFLGSDQTML